MKDAIQILREELKKKNSEIGITTLEDMVKLQIEPLTRDLKKENAELKEQIKLIESVSDANADENAELKRDKEYLDKVNNEQTEVILKLNEQIEKMKCCYNCSKWNEGQCKDIKDSYFYTMADFNCDKWELRND